MFLLGLQEHSDNNKPMDNCDRLNWRFLFPKLCSAFRILVLFITLWNACGCTRVTAQKRLNGFPCNLIL